MEQKCKSVVVKMYLFSSEKKPRKNNVFYSKDENVFTLVLVNVSQKK